MGQEAGVRYLTVATQNTLQSCFLKGGRRLKVEVKRVSLTV